MISQSDTITKQEKNAIGVITLRADKIITFIPDSNATKTSLEILKKDLVTFKEWTKDTGPLPFLSDNRNLKQMNAEERGYIQDKLPLFASKIAIIIDGGLSIYFFNIMAHLNKPEIPMKAFKSFDKGIIWLSEK